MVEEEIFLRLKVLIGEKALNILKTSRVLIFGVGGVGGYIATTLARSAIGKIDLVDKDVFSYSNINRQIGATTKTINRVKVFVLKEILEEINPNIIVNAYNIFYNEKTKNLFDFSKYNYIIDAVDDVNAKILIIKNAKKAGINIISSMGAGNKFNPTDFIVTDIYQTSYCPLAKILRKRLKEEGIKNLKVVCSKEKPKKIKANFVGSTAFNPAAAGIIIASEVFKDILNIN